MPPKSGKGKLNLLNPMSLLSRRRTGQSVDNSSDDFVHVNGRISDTKLADDYDPRIRGKGVHDFSAPRVRKDFSSNGGTRSRPDGQTVGSEYKQSQTSSSEGHRDANSSSPEDGSTRKGDRPRTPMFVEHFDESAGPASLESAVRAESLANAAFISRNSMPLVEPPRLHNRPVSRELHPSFGDNSSPEKDMCGPQSDEELSSDARQTVSLPNAQQPDDSEVRYVSMKPQAASVVDILHQSPPTRLASQASRFSFQIAGGDSAAQERMLEERHKEKAAAKTSRKSSQRFSEQTFDDMEDAYDSDDMYEEDGFEERIPGVNVDADNDAEDVQHLNEDLAAFNFASPQLVADSTESFDCPVSVKMTPRDIEGLPIGFAVSDGSVQTQPESSSSLSDETVAQNFAPNGLGLRNFDGDTLNPSIVMTAPTSSSRDHHVHWSNEPENVDDLYFDDGLIDNLDGADQLSFDESVFDDSNSPFPEVKVPEVSPQNASDEHAPREPRSDELVPDGQKTHGSGSTRNSRHLSVTIPNGSDFLDDSSDVTERRGSHELTRANIVAYHSALAEAANKAAADGKFSRHDSIYADQACVAESSNGTRAHDIPESSQGNALIGADPVLSQSGFYLDDVDDYGYDSEDFGAIDDDPMVAAANAEALANDHDGEYGQEFGFYAQALGKGEIEFANGGYFGPRGVDALGRSMSGRNAVREPNLTPITERSEYSTRNSFISLAQLGAPSLTANGAQAQPSPGLAQLARMSPFGFDDDELSLSHLKKLRRGAFGGSNGSLRSANSSPTLGPNGSHNAYFQPRGASPIATAGMMYSSATTDSDSQSPITNLAGNGASASASVSEYEDETVSPVSATATDLNPLMAEHGREAVKGKLARRDAGTGRRTHSRTGSAADSVTYVKEQSAAGEDRWVLERRRTAESGELELVGREIVEGGRI